MKAIYENSTSDTMSKSSENLDMEKSAAGSTLSSSEKPFLKIEAVRGFKFGTGNAEQTECTKEIIKRALSLASKLNKFKKLHGNSILSINCAISTDAVSNQFLADHHNALTSLTFDKPDCVSLDHALQTLIHTKS